MLREAVSAARIRAMEASEAAAYFHTLGLEELNPAEQALLDEWLAVDERHAEALSRTALAWTRFSDVAGNEILDAMRAHALQARRRPWTDWRRLAAVAACLLFIGVSATMIGMGDFWRAKTPTSSQPELVGATVQYASLRGQIKTVRLADGSQLTLDGDSRAIARFTSKQRSVALIAGRALFTLKHDPSRPFVVDVADQRIIDIGTEFDVNRTTGGMSVTVVSGKVSVAPIGGRRQAIALGSGQQLVTQGGQRTLRTVDWQSAGAATWRTGLLQFDGDTLADAAAEINRHSEKQLLIADQSLASIQVSGQFRAADAERFAETISELYPVRVDHGKNAITLSRR